MRIESSQITNGPHHHFFGYIGHCRTIPYNADDRFILCLETEFQDRMPTGADAAGVVLLDTQNGFEPRRVDESRAWNPQQGTMFYWNPRAPRSQFFFNDRDPSTGNVFTVLYDVERAERVREYRFGDTPVANSGVAQSGGSFMAINYGRIARLRTVTGYPDAYDWTEGVGVPEDDGIFRVDVETGTCDLVCSFRRMVDVLEERAEVSPGDDVQVFINHTLWNREDDMVLFYARSGSHWGGTARKRLNCAFTMRPDGTDLVYHGFVGGHPEWAPGGRIIAEGNEGLRVYDARERAFTGTIGDAAVFFTASGDKALSPDARWLVHGNCVKKESGQFHEYVFYRLKDGFHTTSPLFSRGRYADGGPLRLDPAPCWNRAGSRVAVPAIAADGTRQMFELRMIDEG